LGKSIISRGKTQLEQKTTLYSANLCILNNIIYINIRKHRTAERRQNKVVNTSFKKIKKCGGFQTSHKGILRLSKGFAKPNPLPLACVCTSVQETHSYQYPIFKIFIHIFNFVHHSSVQSLAARTTKVRDPLVENDCSRPYNINDRLI
jgi:hypothetical protein